MRKSFAFLYFVSFVLCVFCVCHTAMADANDDLFAAVEADDTEKIKQALQAGAKLTARNADGDTPQCVAVKNRRVLSKHPKIINGICGDKTTVLYKLLVQTSFWPIVQPFIDAGADVNAPNADDVGETPIFAAVRYGGSVTIKLLSSNGADVNARTKDTGITPLYLAVQEDRCHLLEPLIEAGADVDAVNSYPGNYALGRAIQDGKKDCFDILIAHNANVNYVKSNGGTAVSRAVINKRSEFLKILINAGANVNIPYTSTSGVMWTPLLVAVEYNDEKMVKILLDAGADVTARGDADNLTPLEYARKYNKDNKIIQMLSKYEKTAGVNNTANTVKAENKTEAKTPAPVSLCNLIDDKCNTDMVVRAITANNVNESCDNSWSPLHVAASYQCTDIVRKLIDAHATIDAHQDQRQTPLIVAAYNDNAEIPDMLIKAGADVNAIDNGGATALHVAALNGNVNTARVLLASDKINVDLAETNHKTPLHVAAELCCTNIIKMLIAGGADITKKDKQNKTPVELASDNRCSYNFDTRADSETRAATSETNAASATNEEEFKKCKFADSDLYADLDEETEGECKYTDGVVYSGKLKTLEHVDQSKQCKFKCTENGWDVYLMNDSCENGYKPDSESKSCVADNAASTGSAAANEQTAQTDAEQKKADKLNAAKSRTAAAKEKREKAEANYKEKKDIEQSKENRLLGAATMAATGVGAMELAQGLAEKKADEAAERDMTAYMATFRCDMGMGQNIKGGTTGIEVPGTAALAPMVAKYKALAADLKQRKEALGLKPGIESEVILDSAQMGLYDDRAMEGERVGAFTSLYRALKDPEGKDATDWNAQKEKSQKKIKGGAIAVGAGVVGGIAGDLIINRDKDKNKDKDDSDDSDDGADGKCKYPDEEKYAAEKDNQTFACKVADTGLTYVKNGGLKSDANLVQNAQCEYTCKKNGWSVRLKNASCAQGYKPDTNRKSCVKA